MPEASAVSAAVAGTPFAEVVAPEAVAEAVVPNVPRWPLAVEYDIPPKATGAESYFRLKRAYKQIKFDYLRRLAELRGRKVTITMSISDAAGATEETSNG